MDEIRRRRWAKLRRGGGVLRSSGWPRKRAKIVAVLERGGDEVPTG